MDNINNTKYIDALGGVHWGLIPASLYLPWLMDYVPLEYQRYLWLMLWASIMSCYDISSRRIPNPLTLMVAMFGITYSGLFTGFNGLWNSILAGIITFTIMAIFFFINFVGGGDVKAIASLATLLSPMESIYFMAFIFIGGGIVSILWLILNSSFQNSLFIMGNIKNIKSISQGHEMPYAIAIWTGGILLIFFQF